MIKRELIVFLIVGSLTVLVDFLSYRSLLWFGATGVEVSKATSFLTGTLFAYFANRHWTFNTSRHERGSAWRFAFLYVSTLGVNVLINSLMLSALVNVLSAIQLAFFVATGTSAVLNFLGMKFFVFRARAALETQ